MKIRRTRRNSLKKQKKILVVSALSLILFLTVGYAAFQTNITLNAKGNVKNSTKVSIGGQKVDLVTSGDGLYDNGNGTYTYKGANPANYLSFQGSTWRILGIDSTGIKIIRDESIGNMSFDTANARTTENNPYCTNPSEGCNVWSKDYTPAGSFNNKGLVNEDSTLKTYLNGTYYSSTLNSNSNIIDGTYNVGPINNETAYTWTGKVALLTAPEYKAAALDSSNFRTNNYLKKSSYWWLLSPNADITHSVGYVYSDGSIFGDGAFSSYRGVRPVLYLSSNITLSGSGTSAAPYELTGGGSGGAPSSPYVYAYHTDQRTIGTSAVTDGVADYTQLSSYQNGKTWFLRYELDGNNVIQNAWACQKFSFINEPVCLQGGNASYYGTSSTGNRGIIEGLASTFTSNGGSCAAGDDGSNCNVGDLRAGANSYGNAYASDDQTYQECDVHSNGTANCYE